MAKEAQTADGAADAQDRAQADEQARSERAEQAQADIQAQSEQAKAAQEDTTPDATYVAGAREGVRYGIDRAVPDDALVITTYEDALEAGYLGWAPGHANTEKLSVKAVTERDTKLGLPGTKGLKGAVVNAPAGSKTEAKK